MLRSYLKRPKVRVRFPDYVLSVYRDPAGNAWCLAESQGQQKMIVYLYRHDGELIGDDNLPVERPLP
jgi:hypothetical protein